MAKQQTQQASEPVSANPFGDMRKEALAEAGVAAYYTAEEKEAYATAGTPLFITDLRWKQSEKFKRDFLELAMTTDPSNPNKAGVWGGLHDTPYWRNMEPKLTAFLMAKEAAGEDRVMGPVFAHIREYTNSHGPQIGFDFHDKPQSDTGPNVASDTAGNGGPVDDDIPF